MKPRDSHQFFMPTVTPFSFDNDKSIVSFLETIVLAKYVNQTFFNYIIAFPSRLNECIESEFVNL